MAFILSLITGILFSVVILIIMYEQPSVLDKRLKKAEVEEEGLFDILMSGLRKLVRPVSQRNTQTGSYTNKTRKLLLQAGRAASEEDVIKYETQRIVNVILACVVCLALIILLFSNTIFIACALLLLLVYRLPEMKLKREIKVRKKEFMRHLPDAVDLISICVQAGLSLDASFARVSEEFALSSQTVSIEFDRLNKDILAGLNRQEAYKNLVLRNENPDLQSFVALLIQTDKLGTSISQSLDAFCDALRTKKRQRIEELSQQASTKMTIPMVLFLLPSIFIVILYPAIQKIMEAFGKM